LAHFPIHASPSPLTTGSSEEAHGSRRASQRALRLFCLGSGALIFAFQVAAVTERVPILAAVTFAVPTALLLFGFASAIWALADMGKDRETRSGTVAALIVVFPLFMGALLSLAGALLTLFVTVYLARAL
jgi:hypothetical protein